MYIYVGTLAVAGRESGVIDGIFLPQVDHLIKRIGIKARQQRIEYAFTAALWSFLSHL